MGREIKTQGPFGLTCEAPHTYLTGASQQVGHSRPRTSEGKELDASFLEKIKKKPEVTLKPQIPERNKKRREEEL